MQTENALHRKRRLKNALAAVVALLVLSTAALVIYLKFFYNGNDGRSGTILIEAGAQRHEEPNE